MTASELLAWQIDDVGNQILKTLENLPAEHRDARVVPGAMSPNDVIEHLCECYEAAAAVAEGRKHPWGSFAFVEETWDERLARWRELRSRAKALVTGGDDPKPLTEGYEYIVGHDAYHVGQLCQLRLHLDPKWDSMSIYG